MRAIPHPSETEETYVKRFVIPPSEIPQSQPMEFFARSILIHNSPTITVRLNNSEPVLMVQNQLVWGNFRSFQVVTTEGATNTEIYISNGWLLRDKSDVILIGDSVGLALEATLQNVLSEFQHITIGSGRKTIVTAGTPERLSGFSVACKQVHIQALKDNTADVGVGGSGVDASASGTGIILSAGDAVTLQIEDLYSVYIDVLTNGEGVRYTYTN